MKGIIKLAPIEKPEDEDWGYQQLHDRDGFEIEVNKNSIINAPNIELK